jgi:hypothetical protein
MPGTAACLPEDNWSNAAAAQAKSMDTIRLLRSVRRLNENQNRSLA